MPRLRPPRQAEVTNDDLLIDDTPPTEDVVFELSDDELDPPATPAEPALPVEPEPGPDDALKRAVEAQQRAETIARNATRERDEAVRRSQQHEADAARDRTERVDAEFNSVLTAIAAEQSALDKATMDLEVATQNQDARASAGAQRAIAVAASRLDRLEENKAAYDKRKEAPPATPERRANPSTEEQIASFKVPDEAKDWLRIHPELVSDPHKLALLGNVHQSVTEARGIKEFTKEYFEAMDETFRFKPAAQAAPGATVPAPAPAAPRRSMPVTAPVSREVPTSTGERQSTGVTLTPEERAIARSSFSDPTGKMTNAEKERLYAKNKLKLQNMRASGAYPARERA